MGVALAHRIASSGYDVYLLTSIPQRAKALEENRQLKSIVPELKELHYRVRVTTDSSDIANHCTTIFLTVSDAYFRRLLDPLGKHLDGAHRIVHAVHNLYGRSLKRTSDMIQSLTSVKQIGVIAGPIHVSELLAGMPNAAVIASEFPSLIADSQQILSDGNLMIQEQKDLFGVELAAALQQVVTLAIGISDGLELGAATHSALATTGIAEVALVGEHLGANPRTFFGVAGLGRLVDALRRGEPNYELGMEIAQSDSIGDTLAEAPPEAKAVEIVRQVVAWTEDSGIALPMTHGLAEIFDGADREPVLRRLMRDKGLFSTAEA
jgi:glycerol-3-phosphate dehydrogenase (NAD(P)+)